MITYEMGELGWISQEEDRCVIGNNIPIALLRSEFDRESSRITSAVM